ncbi:serine--tRNA ligase [Rhodopirellula sallentina]|uniref:Serine--tRNA ligase n=1 Tax=Rhodopirellula sallentina SM41 TaxID=1263870 RepID=M5TT20_9BACT|nr:serine--tRNA ligase [Rhodopirellula sallentina]EMI52305.1 seryl-tRNA synthetase [Rhodopirellula sallentina SM41]
MLDRKFILQNPELVRENSARRGVSVDVQSICELESQRLAALKRSQEFNTQANETSKRIAGAKDNEERQKLIAEGRALREQKDAAAAEQSDLEAKILELQTVLPNLTHPAVPDGGEDDAKELGFGKTEKPTFDFKPIDHLEIGEKHDMFDFEGGARVAGSGFYFLRNAAVRLDLALQQFAISFLSDRGFTPVSTPDLALTSVLQGTGFNPRGPETQIYSIENTELNLVATAEITLGGMLSGQILESEKLPLKLCGLSHCFRTEAGAAGRASRGLYRVHQFTKIEMFAFTLPEQSEAIHEEMRELECELFDALEVPYRVVDTAAGDLGGPAYRKYDLEAWMPGRGEGGQWGEVTSTSNCTDYQARRLDVRYKTPGQKGTQYVHTLNGTAVATGRAMIAILENHQRADGSVAVPKVLQPWVGKEVLEPIASMA